MCSIYLHFYLFFALISVFTIFTFFSPFFILSSCSLHTFFKEELCLRKFQLLFYPFTHCWWLLDIIKTKIQNFFHCITATQFYSRHVHGIHPQSQSKCKVFSLCIARYSFQKNKIKYRITSKVRICVCCWMTMLF